MHGVVAQCGENEGIECNRDQLERGDENQFAFDALHVQCLVKLFVMADYYGQKLTLRPVLCQSVTESIAFMRNEQTFSASDARPFIAHSRFFPTFPAPR
jgi:hypothetical protein